MIKTNLTTKTKTVTFGNDADEYSGLSFQYIQNDAEAWVIIDWLNGGESAPSGLGSFTINEDQYDTAFLNRGLTTTVSEYVRERLIQNLNIHLNEFNYRYENTEDIGLPYLQKPRREDLDLFIREAILNTVGVKEIVSFASNILSKDAGEAGKNKQTYYAEFEIKTESGEILWQSIET